MKGGIAPLGKGYRSLRVGNLHNKTTDSVPVQLFWINPNTISSGIPIIQNRIFAKRI